MKICSLLLFLLVIGGCEEKRIVISPTPPPETLAQSPQVNPTPQPPPPAKPDPQSGRPYELSRIDPPDPDQGNPKAWSQLIEINLSSQTFTASDEGKPVFSGPISSASNGLNLGTDEEPKSAKTPHNHLGEFLVFDKKPRHFSRTYKVWMEKCLFFYGGHAVHACQSSDISKLGRPDSHGCVRVHPDMAKKLYSWAQIGCRVRINP